MDVARLGVKVLGEVPRGLPPFGFPAKHPSDINDLLPLALACFLLGAVETAALGRMFALKHGYRFDANQELLGIAGANVMAGLGHGFPVSGGMSRSLVNESGGARTPMSGLIAAVFMFLVVLFLSGAEMLAGLHGELAPANVRLQIVEARASVRDRLEAEGVESKVGRIGRFTSVAIRWMIL
jgi:MFS superfamily sulfate permease-like transporter